MKVSSVSAILITCVIQIQAVYNQSQEVTLTTVHNKTGEVNITVAYNQTQNVNITTSKNITQEVITAENNQTQELNMAASSNQSLEMNTTSQEALDFMEAANSTIEEVMMAPGAPAMSGGVNCTVEGSSCWFRMLNTTQACANETGASQDDVDIAMRMEIPSSDSGKCLTRCLLKLRGLMTAEGAFAPKATVDYLTEAQENTSLRDEYQKMVDYCSSKLKLQPMSNLDTCQFAYDIATCTEEHHKTLFLRNPAMAPPVNAITTP